MAVKNLVSFELALSTCYLTSSVLGQSGKKD